MQRWLLLAVLLGLPLTPCQTTYAQSVANGLIGYWPFDGNGGDLSGGARHLTLYDGAGFAGGLFGSALDLHANNSQYAGRTVDDDVFDFGANDFTVQIWVNYSTFAREQTLFEKLAGSRGPGWTLSSLASDSTAHFRADDVGIYGPAAPNVQTGVWRQFAVRRQGTTIDVIYDGAIFATEVTAQPVFDTAFPLIIGRRNAADSRDFSVDGRLDEAAIWNRALSNSEIAFLYNGGAGNPVIVPEPSAGALAAIALLVLHRRRKCARLIQRPSARRTLSLAPLMAIPLAIIASAPQRVFALDPVKNPTNGHYYNVVLGPINWSDANASASAMTYQGVAGHLVAVTAAQENQFLLDAFGQDALLYTWLGGLQPAGATEPAGGWAWGTGEPFQFANWYPAEPNNAGGLENRVVFDHGPWASGMGWNDLGDTTTARGYVIEFPVPEPSGAVLAAAAALGLGRRRRGN